MSSFNVTMDVTMEMRGTFLRTARKNIMDFSRETWKSSKTHTSTMISHPAEKLADRFYLKRLTLFSHLFI